MSFVVSALEMVKSVRIQDILDVTIIALMIFALLTWFKTRASRFVLIGIILLAGVYMAARFFQLYLTTIVLQGFFAILLFVLVVIFQEDLRGFFERLALLGNIAKKYPSLEGLKDMAGIISQTAAGLARKKIGALMVIQGNDPLERHIHGGKELDGIVSEELLESIFDPHSVGHDGAVIISGHRVKKFGCHLPLSSHTAQYGNIGLRHTAALGLAERTDALCVVVSEERGTLSVAYREKLNSVASASALHEILNDFFVRNTPSKNSHPALNWLKENTLEKVIAIGLACLLWVVFGYQRDMVRRDFIVPVEYKNVPQNWQIEEPQLTEVKVVLQGSEQAFRLLDERSLKASLDMASMDRKREYALTKEMINVPSSLTVADIVPAKINVYASKRIPWTLPVHVNTLHAPPEGIVLQKISVEPSRIRVFISPKINPDNLQIETEPIDLQNVFFSTTLHAKILPPPGVHFPDEKNLMARIHIQVKKKMAR